MAENCMPVGRQVPNFISVFQASKCPPGQAVRTGNILTWKTASYKSPAGGFRGQLEQEKNQNLATLRQHLSRQVGDFFTGIDKQ